MPLFFDHQLREYMKYDATVFPISYYENEFVTLPARMIPVHWHPEFECVSAVREALELQVGQARVVLNAGDSVLINGNVLHGMRQMQGEDPEPMPNIVFSGTLIAPEGTAIYEKYIRSFADSNGLPYVRFTHGRGWHDEINDALMEVYGQLRLGEDCHEMVVQRLLNGVFEGLHRHWDELPRLEATRIQIAAQIRIQKMLSYIRANYARPVTLSDIAVAANISRSEANRCFKAFMNRTPIEALNQYRLEMARKLLADTTLTLREIAETCGFHSETWFSRSYRRVYGCAPGQGRRRK